MIKFFALAKATGSDAASSNISLLVVNKKLSRWMAYSSNSSALEPYAAYSIIFWRSKSKPILQQT